MPKTKRQNARRRRQQRSKFVTKLIARLQELKRFSKKNFLAIAGIIVTIVTSYYIYRLSNDLPDIRMIEGVESEDLDVRLDGYDSVVFLTSDTFVFKNFSLKSGFIDKVEAAPKTLDGLPIVQVVHIDKTLIGWREEKEIEIRLKMVSPIAAIKDLVGTNVTDVFKAEVEIRFYDNTGKLIAISPTGEVGPLIMRYGYSFNREELKKKMNE